MPNLENLRKQAKLVLRWHRDRYYPVAAQIRSVLPRFRHLSDPEILRIRSSSRMRRNWSPGNRDSKAGRRSEKDCKPCQNSSAQTTTRPVITAVAAELFVSDIQASCDFFTQQARLHRRLCLRRAAVLRTGEARCGAAQPQAHGSPGDRSGSCATASNCCRPTWVSTRPTRSSSFTWSSSKAGVEFQQTLMRQPWGAKNFVVRDPDGNLLLFAGPAE